MVHINNKNLMNTLLSKWKCDVKCHDPSLGLTTKAKAWKSAYQECNSRIRFRLSRVWEGVATPLWGKCEDETHTPKSGNLESFKTPKNLELIAGVKTPHIKVFFIPLERSWNLNVQNGLIWAIWTSSTHVMGKRRAKSQIVNLTFDH
jgi:hypothetical protein